MSLDHSRAQSLLPSLVEWQRPIGRKEVQIAASWVVSLKNEHVGEVGLQYARQILLGFEFVLVVMVLLVIFLDHGVAGENPSVFDSLANRTHQGGDFRLGEMLDRRIPDDVVPSSIRQVASNVTHGVRHISSTKVFLSMGYGSRIEIDGVNPARADAIEMVGVEAIPATQLENRRAWFDSEQIENAAFPAERDPSIEPLCVLIDEVIKPLRIRRKSPFHEHLKPVSGSRQGSQTSIDTFYRRESTVLSYESSDGSYPHMNSPSVLEAPSNSRTLA